MTTLSFHHRPDSREFDEMHIAMPYLVLTFIALIVGTASVYLYAAFH